MFKMMLDVTRVAVMLIPIILAGCKNEESEARFWENEREKIELTQRLKLVEYRLGQSESSDVMELARFNRLLEETDLKLHNLNQNKLALSTEIEGMKTRNEESYRITLQNQRDRVHGMKFDSFSTKDGRTFHHVSIAEVGDSGVRIRHEHGAARLRYADLSDEQRLIFGLDEATSLAAENRERVETLAYERSIDLELEAMRQRDNLADAVAQQNDEASISPLSLADSSNQSANRPLAQPARRFGSGTSYRRWSGYSRYRYYQPAYRYVYRYATVPNPFGSSSQPRRQVSGRSTCSPSDLPEAPSFIPTHP